jgi:PiT family inorganic phosphate transporter
MVCSAALVVSIIAVALVFDYINGFHDAANAIATVVSTRVLRPQTAVLLAATGDFCAFLFFGVHVAKTIGTGVVHTAIVDPIVVLAALLGAIAWDLLTWYYGLPSSSSHALIGGLCGAAISKAGTGSLVLMGLFKISISIILSPLLGMILGLILMTGVSNLFVKATPQKVDRWFRRLQLISASLYSLGHGGNDAQKTMGIISVLLFSAGMLGKSFHVPFWVVIACNGAMALGTLSGGWRIVRTMGMKITKLKPVGGFCAETGGAITLFLATFLGIPVSTTHTITGAIVGVGTVNKLSAVRWGVAGRIVWAWIFTIPAAAAISSISWIVLDQLHTWNIIR